MFVVQARAHRCTHTHTRARARASAPTHSLSPNVRMQNTYPLIVIIIVNVKERENTHTSVHYTDTDTDPSTIYKGLPDMFRSHIHNTVGLPPAPSYRLFFIILFLPLCTSRTPPKGGRGCLMSPPCLESQGCHLIPLCYLLSCSSA